MQTMSPPRRGKRPGILFCLFLISLLLLAWSVAGASPGESQGTAALYLPFARGGAGAAPITATPTQPGSPSVTPTPTATVTTVPGPGSEAASFFLDDSGEPASLYNASIEADSTGRLHATFHDFSSDDGNHTIYYATCERSCEDASSFVVVPVGSSNGGTYFTSLNIAIDGSGRPRLLWGTDEGFEYAQCNSACTTSASWAQATVATIDNFEHGHSTRFALDAQGRPRFIYRDEFGAPDENHEGTWFAYCNSGCTSEANWHETKLTAEEWEIPSLEFTGAGLPRFTMLGDYHEDTSLRQVGYVECATATCSTWDGLYFGGIFSEGTVELELDSAGRPRVAVHTGEGWEPVAGIEPDQLYYLWCNSGCAGSGTWNDVALFEPGIGNALDLELDSQNRPALSLERSGVDHDELGVIFARCTAGCEGTSPTWQVHDIDLTAELNASYPVPPPDDCDISVWSLTDQTDLTLDPATGSPRVIHTAEHRVLCDGTIRTVNAGIRFRALTLP